MEPLMGCYPPIPLNNMACIHLFMYSTTLSILLGYQLRSTHVESSINATPVVCDSKQVVEYRESDSNNTYCGKCQLAM